VSVVALFVAYLLGAVPFALLLTRWARGVDVRRVGSGNPGAANVWRSTGAGLGLAVLMLDCAKGATAVMFAVIAPWATVAATLAFAVCVGLTRYVSLGSLLGAIALTVAALALVEPAPIVAAAGAAAALIIWRHRENIGRLRRGEELRIGHACRP